MTKRLQLDVSHSADDFVVYEDEGDLFQKDEKSRYYRQQDTQKVMADCSLRRFCELMFLKPTMDITIRGVAVASKQLTHELTQVSTHLLLADPDDRLGTEAMAPVSVHIGCHSEHAQLQLSGTMLYQDNALVTFYGRENIDEVAGRLGNKHGVLLVCSLPSSEFETKHTKTAFLNQGRLKKTLKQMGAHFKKYVNEMDNASAQATPEADLETAAFEPNYKWVQCAQCEKWRVLNNFETLEAAEEYLLKYANKDWCCDFDGSPVRTCGACSVACDATRFVELNEISVSAPTYAALAPHAAPQFPSQDSVEDEEMSEQTRRYYEEQEANVDAALASI